MNKFITKIGTGLAIASVLGLSLAPMASASTVIVSGNGAFSTNTVRVVRRSTSTTTQTNNTFMFNSVTTNSNTGSNSTGFNTGGSTLLFTGNASNDVSILNLAGLNVIH